MKRLFVLMPPIWLLCACGGENTSGVSTEQDSVVVERDTVFTVSATLDGPEGDEWFYPMFPDSFSLEGIKEIHVVPRTEDSALVHEFMFAIAQNDYEFYGEVFKTYSGRVVVFYDANKELLVTEYQLQSGLPQGQIDVFNPASEKIVSRVYDQGECIKSTLDLYATDWTFNPKNASLVIENLAQYQTIDAYGGQTISIGPSIHATSDGSENAQFDMIRKDVFENDFFINGAAFTGCLLGHFQYVNLTPESYFELHFVNGKLQDTIRVYGPWGLELEEVYANGELVEVIYQAEEMDGMAKPVIYLYPEEFTDVHVQMNLDGKMTHSYPKYPAGGWKVKAQPNGTLYDEHGKEYYALFWEGISSRDFTYSEGFVIKGTETELFLESSLEILGLTRREANEFIMYWLPQMENNAYNLIHFSTKEYEEIAELKITPNPESVIRIMMVWSPLEKMIEMPQQNLYELKQVRQGFTVVEWGGKRQDYRKAI